MEEKQTIEQAREQLKNSVGTAWSDFKGYSKAVIDQTVDSYKQHVDDARVQREFNKEERAREAEIRERTEDHRNGMKEAFREQERQEKAERRLRFREDVKQKASSFKSKLGNLKNNLLAKLNMSNLGVKMRNTWDNVQISTLEGLQKGKEFAQGVGSKVSDFTTTQIANYHLHQEERQQEREEIRQIQEEERAREAEIRERTEDHKNGMKEAFREQERQEKAERRLRFREDVKQKASSFKSKLGNLKNNLLAKLNMSNLGVKMRNTWDNVQISTLEGLQKGKEFAQGVESKVSDFTTTQIANYHLHQEERQQERERKEFEKAARKAEQEAIDLAKEQLKERKAAMAAALNSEEREKYNQQHIENIQRKQELMEELFGSSSNDIEIEGLARTM